MAAADQVVIKAGEAMRMVNITVRLSGVGVLRARLWLSGKLFKLAASVAGCGLVIIDK